MSKLFVITQVFLLLGIFGFFYFFLPHLDYPKDNELFNQNTVDFKFRNANVILIDDNPDFTSPKEINLETTNITKIRFDPGTYYWKAEGDLVESSQRKFIINSNVGLELDSNNSTLKNVGDVSLNITEESENGINGLVILDIEVEYPVDVKNKTVYRGVQYEN